MSEVEGSDFELKADLVTLAMGFVHPVHEGMLADLGVALDGRGNVQGHRGCRGVQDVYRGRVQRRRHAPWSVAGGLGDSRRPAVRARVDEYLMGHDQPAALIFHLGW